MRKQILLIAVSVFLIIGFFTVSVTAAEAGSGKVLCLDSAYCVKSDEDLAALNDKLNDISARQNCEVVIYTTNTFDGKTPTDYADDYYDASGYGWGKDKSGILFVINPQSRDWAISTCGFGITAFTDAGQEYMVEQMSGALSENDYLTAFNQYADMCDEFITQARTGEPYDNGSLPGEEKDINLAVDIIIGLVIGIIIAFIIVGTDKAALKTVRRQADANNYIRSGSLRLTRQHDNFLYKNVDVTERESSSGSSTHTSSSGATHGGSSGKF